MQVGQIIKSKSAGNFTIIPNEVLRDESLSWKAKGLLSYLLSLPPGWVVYKKEICDHSKDGRESTYTAFKELEEVGYVLSVEVRDENGRFKGVNYIVYETATQTEKPDTENPYTVKPDTENPSLYNTNSNNTNNSKKENEIEFDHFILLFNETTERDFKGDRQSKGHFNARLREGYTVEQMVKALKIAFEKDKFIVDNGHLTPEFILRADKLQKYLNMMPSTKMADYFSPEDRYRLRQEAEKRKEEQSKLRTA